MKCSPKQEIPLPRPEKLRMGILLHSLVLPKKPEHRVTPPRDMVPYYVKTQKWHWYVLHVDAIYAKHSMFNLVPARTSIMPENAGKGKTKMLSMITSLLFTERQMDLRRFYTPQNTQR